MPVFKIPAEAQLTDNNVIEWQHQSVTTSKKPRVQKRADEYPLMGQFAKMVTEPEWVCLFERAAAGHLPKYFMLRQNRLSVKLQNTVIPCDLPTDPVAALDIAKTFISQHTNLSLPLPASDKVVAAKTLPKSLAHRRLLRVAMLEHFLRREVRKHKLTEREYARLRFLVFVGFVVGFYKSKDIRVDQKLQVFAINGMTFDRKIRRYSFTTQNIEQSMKVEKPKPKQERRHDVKVAQIVQQMQLQQAARSYDGLVLNPANTATDLRHLAAATDM